MQTSITGGGKGGAPGDTCTRQRCCVQTVSLSRHVAGAAMGGREEGGFCGETWANKGSLWVGQNVLKVSIDDEVSR